MKGKWCLIVKNKMDDKVVVGPFEDYDRMLAFGKSAFVNCVITPTILYGEPDYGRNEHDYSEPDYALNMEGD
jgi:hypothetical protein